MQRVRLAMDPRVRFAGAGCQVGPGPEGLRWRGLVAPSDPHQDSEAEMLAQLMLDAYRGTIDDAGETLSDSRQEVAKLLRGEYGILDRDASIVLADERAPGLVAATLVTHERDIPLIAFSLTHPAWQRRGFGRAGLRHALGVLAQRGYELVRLVVTVGNSPAERLYASLGFAPDRPTGFEGHGVSGVRK